MKWEQMEAEQALQCGCRLPYALVRSLSKVELGPTPKQVDLCELQDARFFNDREEIRIFWYNGGLTGGRYVREDQDVVIEREYPLEDPKLGHSLLICAHVETDEDGQSYISAERLSGWKEGA